MRNCIVIVALFFACGQKPGNFGWNEANEIIAISMDPEKTETTYLSDFFEDDIQYVWMEDKLDKNGQIGKWDEIIVHKDIFIVVDRGRKQAIYIFGKQGKWYKTINALGEGPGEYLEMGNVQVVQDTLVLLSVYPSKLMFFDLEGIFLKEKPLSFVAQFFTFDSNSDQYLFYRNAAFGDNGYDVYVTNKNLEAVEKFFPLDDKIFRPPFGTSLNFFQIKNQVYYAREMLDTVYRFDSFRFVPALVMNYGKAAIDHHYWIQRKKETIPPEFLKEFNEMDAVYYSPRGAHTGTLSITINRYKGGNYLSVLDKVQKRMRWVEGSIINDLDEGPDLSFPEFTIGEDRIGFAKSGKELYRLAMERRAEMDEKQWQIFQKGKGSGFVKAALDAKDSENPVLILLKLKK